MLKIIMGTQMVTKYLTDGRKFEPYVNDYFNFELEESWLEDKLAKDIIRDIDKAVVIAGTAIRSLVSGQTYSATNLSGGTKLLLSVYNRPDKVLRMTMGDNCTDYLERIASIHHKNGKDILLVSDYLHHFNFKYTDAIEYINWNVICHNREDVLNNVTFKWYDQEEKYKRQRLGIEYSDLNSSEWTDEDEANLEAFNKRVNGEK